MTAQEIKDRLSNAGIPFVATMPKSALQELYDKAEADGVFVKPQAEELHVEAETLPVVENRIVTAKQYVSVGNLIHDGIEYSAGDIVSVGALATEMLLSKGLIK